MNYDKKTLLGKLNTDIDERLFSSEGFSGDYSDAYNVLVLSAIDSGVGLVKGFKGTTEIPIDYGYSSSLRKIVGRGVDLQNRKIYFLVAHNSIPTIRDAIYELDVTTKTVELILKGTFLKLDNTLKITGIDIIDGKYLLYTDGKNEPRNIDIQRAKDNELTLETQITNMKPAPTRGPYGLENATDPSYGDNNIRGSFFQFKYRWKYKDNTKSTFSPISKISTMGNLFMPEVEQVSSYQESNTIKFKYAIPNEDIVSIDIAARVGNTGDFSIVETLLADPNKVYKKQLLYFRGVDTNAGITVSISVDGSTPISVTSFVSSVGALIDIVYAFLLANNIDDDLIITKDVSASYISMSSRTGGLNFYLEVSNSNLVDIVSITELPFIGGDNEYSFKNNNVLIALDVRDSNLQYDRIPLRALAQKAVNGSNIIYGGITEGFDVGDVDINAQSITQLGSVSTLTTVEAASELALIGPIFTGIRHIELAFNITFNDGATTSITIDPGFYSSVDLTNVIYDKFKIAKPTIKIYKPNPDYVIILSDYGNDITCTGGPDVRTDDYARGSNINYFLTGGLQINSLFIVKVQAGNANYYFSYTSVFGDTLASALIKLCNNINKNSVNIIAYPVPTVPSAIKIYSTKGDEIVASSNLSISPLEYSPSLKGGDSYTAGIVYSDEFGRLSTVTTNQNCNIDTQFNNSSSPKSIKPVVFISSRPPIWAKYWHLVLTRRKRVGFFLQFNITTIGADGDKMRFYFKGDRSNIPFYNKTFGAKLSYDFAEGDRVKFLRYNNGTAFPVAEDLPILGISENGAIETPFLKTIPLDYSALDSCVVEVYRPNNYSESAADEILFYETGLSGLVENFGLNNRYHGVYEEDLESGEAQPQTSTLSYPLICRPVTGDVWSKASRLINHTSDGGGIPVSWSVGNIAYYVSMYQSDRYPVTTTNEGRPNALDQDAKQVFRRSTAYFSDSYFIDSSVNNINRIYADSFKDYDQTYGAIKLFHLDGFNLYMFQEYRVGAIPVNKQMVYNQDGSSSLILSSQLLNESRYFDYAGGIGDNPESFCFNQFNQYFVDMQNNAVCKIGGNGIIKISDMGMSSHFTALFSRYKNIDLSLTGGQTPRFYGSWDENNKLVIFSPETIIATYPEPDPPITISGDTIAFSERSNGWSTKIDFKPSAIIGVFGELISWEPGTGKAWLHNSNETRNLFYGSQKTRLIAFVSSVSPDASKSFLVLQQEPDMLSADRYDSIEGSNVDPSIWGVSSILTSLGQQSNLIVSDFIKKEGIYYANFLRDTTTPVTNSLLEGDALKGVWIKILLSNSSTLDVGLYSAVVGFIPSKRVVI